MHIYTTPDPAPWFHKMRAENPVYYEPEFIFFFGAKGAWQLFRHEDVQNALSDHHLFSSELLPKGDGGLGDSFFMTDPPRHRQLRSLVSKAFVPSIVNPIEDWIREQCEELLYPWLKAGELEFIKRFADELPARVICRLLGVPQEHCPQTIQWTNLLGGDPRVIGFDAFAKAQMEMSSLFMQLIRERMQVPADDLITRLIDAEIDGDKLTARDILSFCIALLTGGNETTAALLGNAMLIFAERPALQEHLRNTPQDIPKAIAEVLRFRAPLMSVPRIAREDAVLNGHQLRKGELLSCWVASANLDPAVFPSPDLFDIHRDHSGLLSFGHGIHYCIGAFLAKLEARLAFETIFRHLRNIRIAPGHVLSRVPGSVTCKYESLPLAFDAPHSL